jgi:hypothetical protein
MAERADDPELKNVWLCLAARWLSLIPSPERTENRQAGFDTGKESASIG